MTAIATFVDPVFGQIRAIKSEDDKPLFIAADVAVALGYSKPRNAVNAHCKGALKQSLPTKGGAQDVTLIPEADLYRLIMKSKLPKAEAFQDWVTEEILPAVRKTGGYIATKEDDSEADIMARALLIAQQTLERKNSHIQVLESKNALLEEVSNEQQKQIEMNAPKALFADSVTTSRDSILVAELATILKQNGVDTGQNRLFEWLRHNGYLCVKGERYNLPTQKAMELGLFEIKKHTHNAGSGEVRVTETPKVTGKGQLYFVNKFITKHNKEDESDY